MDDSDSDEPPAPPAVAAAPWQPPATGAPGVFWAPRGDVAALHTGVNAATASRRLHMTAWSVALEFLPAERVISAKSVSRELRGAARLVLTRGRYRPVTRWLKLLSLYASIDRDSYDDPYYYPDKSWHSITGAEGLKPIIRAAWLLEPSLVVEAVFQTDVHPHLVRWAMHIFEPHSMAWSGSSRRWSVHAHSCTGATHQSWLLRHSCNYTLALENRFLRNTGAFGSVRSGLTQRATIIADANESPRCVFSTRYKTGATRIV